MQQASKIMLDILAKIYDLYTCTYNKLYKSAFIYFWFFFFLFHVFWDFVAFLAMNFRDIHYNYITCRQSYA